MSWVGVGPEMMEHDVELEEGEAGYLISNNDDNDDNHDRSIDPDVALSYIDDKLQSVLGHFQKDFEGGVSAEKLGAIYGGYGSFLPMYQRSPAILPQQKTPQSVQSNISQTPDRLHREGASRNSSSTPAATLRERDGDTAPHVMHSLHDEKGSLGNDMHQKEKDLSSEQVAEKLPPRYKPSPNKPPNVTDQKTLKFRIKVGSGKSSAPKNVAIYSGLGLNSPSSSHGNSSAASGEVPCESRENNQESPTRILQMLSTLTDALGPLLSPLSDRFLNLLSDVPMEGKSSSAMKEKLHQSTTFEDHSVSKVDDQVINKKKKINTTEKREPVQEDAILLRLKENSGAEALDSEKPQSDCVNKSGGSLRNSSKQLALLKGVEKGSQTKNRKLNNNSIKGKSLGTDVVKDKSLDLEPGQDVTKFKRQDATSSSVEKIVVKDPPCEIPEIRRNEVNGATFSSKSESDTLESGKTKENDHLLPKDGLRSTSHDQEKSRLPDRGKKMPPESKRKSKLGQVNGKLPSDSVDYGSDAGLSTASEKKNGRKDISKAREMYEDLFGSSEAATGGSSVDPVEEPPSNNGSKGLIDTIKNENVHRDRLKAKTRRNNKVISQQTTESSMRDPLNHSVPRDNELLLEVEEPASRPLETEQTAAAPVWIEDWVQCDRCEKWRLIPFGRKPEEFSKTWVCTMLDWLPGMNRCDISQEATTSALHASYVPLPDNTNASQSHADRVLTGVNNSYASNSDVFSGNVTNGSKNNKHNVKGTSSRKVSNMTSAARNIEQSPVRRESFNGKKQLSSGVKPISNSIGQHRNAAEKHSNNQKLEHIPRGEVKMKRKSKEAIDQYEQQITKKVKTARSSDILESPSSNGSLGRNERRKSVEHSRTKDVKSEEGITLQPSAKQVEDTLFGGSVDVKRASDSHMSLKKRKLMDWQNSQSNVEALKNDGQSFTEGMMIALAGEDSDSGVVGRIKKPMVSQTDANLLSRTKVNDEATQKEMKNRLLASDKDLQNEKQVKEHKTKVSSQLTKADLELLKNSLTSEQIPAAATSSSSKVSDSCKTRAHYLENKDSPVESVSSSPLRIPTVHKHSLKDDVKAAGDFPTFRGPLKLENGSCDSRKSGKVKVRRPASIGHPESLNNHDLKIRESENVGNSVGNGLPEANEPHSEPCYDKDRTSRKRNSMSLHPKSGMTASMVPMDKERSSDLNSKEPPEKEFPPRDRQNMSKPKKHSRVTAEVDQSLVVPPSEGLYDNNRQKSTSGSVKSSKVVNKASKKIDKRENGIKREYQSSKDPCPQDANVHNHLSEVRGSFPVEVSGDEKRDPGQHTKVKHEMLPTDVIVPPDHQKKKLAVLPPSDASGCRESKDFGKSIHKSEPLDGTAHSVPDGAVAQIPTGPSFSKSNSSAQAASVVLQEAEAFKEYADRLKGNGFGFECNETYFQAALKYLHGASLLECTNGSRKHDEMNETQIYIISAKLCETCAEEFERRQEMAAAALAYKCMEVAYMRVVYCKNNTVHRLCSDLRSSLQIVPQGESPSSSASDIDNLNNHALGDKTSLSKSNGTHVESNHILASRSRSSFARLLDFTKYVNLAMEASMKCQNALATANVMLEEAQNKDGIVSVKRVIDFSFQDVEELVRLVGLAKEAINRKAFCGTRN